MGLCGVPRFQRLLQAFYVTKTPLTYGYMKSDPLNLSLFKSIFLLICVLP